MPIHVNILLEEKTFLQTRHPFLLQLTIGMLLLRLLYRLVLLDKALNVNLIRKIKQFVILPSV